jgi:hypothetical protein
MAGSLNPAATYHLPSFIPAPGETDVLMVVMAVVLPLSILGFGILFFRLHSLPERIAHKSQRLQFEVVAVLGLISLFTHMHIFWIVGLLLALVEFPDFGTPLAWIARSAEKIAGIEPQANQPASAHASDEIHAVASGLGERTGNVDVQDYIAAGQFRGGEQLFDVQQVTRPGTLTVLLEPLFAGGLDGVTAGSSCIANAYSSNHDIIVASDTSALRAAALHVVDALALVHALILRLQALVLPFQNLVFSGH